MNLIPAELYQDIYLILVTILSLFCLGKYAVYDEGRLYDGGQKDNFGIILLTLFLVLFIGFRPNAGHFVDMGAYYSRYWSAFGLNFHWTWDTDNKIFDNLLLWMASMRIDVNVFFVAIAAIYFSGMAVACSMLFPNDKMAAYLVCLAAFSTFSYGVNGLKAGMAASLFLIALAFNDRDNKWLTVLFILLSLGFHHSMQLPVVAFVVCKFVKNPKYYIWLWLFSFVMALAHVTFFMGIFEGMTDEQGAGYLAGAIETYKGFRFDFVLYSATPILIGCIARTKKLIVSENYEFLLNLYTLINAVWLLCMYAEFTNRIAYLSWFMLPIVLMYPYLREQWGSNQYQAFRSVALGHLGFTLFMKIIYYGFIYSQIRG